MKNIKKNKEKKWIIATFIFVLLFLITIPFLIFNIKKQQIKIEKNLKEIIEKKKEWEKIKDSLKFFRER